MWILIRLVVALGAFCARLMHGWFPPKATGRLTDGTPYFEKKRKRKGGDGRIERIGVPLSAPILLRLQRETGSDRWFKSIGLATEFQTGSARFDGLVYIACDNPWTMRLLGNSDAARDAVLKVLAAGYKRIELDGEVLWLHPGKRGIARNQAELLLTLRDALRKVEHVGRYPIDPFAKRIALIEAAVWSVFGFALTAYFQFRMDASEVHVEPFDLLYPAIVIACLLLFAMLSLVALTLRGSSFAHYVLIESGVLLLLAAPVGGLQAAADLNRLLDTAPAVNVSREIIDRTTVHRRKAANRHRVLLKPGPMSDEFALPRSIDVERAVFDRAAPGRLLEVSVGPGWLGAPWYRSVKVRDPPPAAQE